MPRFAARLCRFAVFSQQLFFRRPALLPQRVQLKCVKLGPFGGELRFDVPGKREIDVIAAEQYVLANGDPVQLQFTLALGHRDQREIGSAAADIDHQDQIAHPDAIAPIWVTLQPCIKGRLRLFEENYIRVASFLSGALRQFAGDRIERSGNRHQ